MPSLCQTLKSMVLLTIFSSSFKGKQLNIYFVLFLVLNIPISYPCELLTQISNLSFLLTVLIMLPSPFHCIHTKRISVPHFASRPFRVLPTPQSTGPLAYFLAHFHTLASSPILREAFAALADEVCPPSLSNADHSYGSCLSCSPLCLQIQAQQWELYDYNSNHLSHKDLHFAEWPTSLFPPLGQPYLLLLPEMFAPFPQLFV